MKKVYIGVAAVAVLVGGYWWLSQPSDGMRPMATDGMRPIVSTAMHGARSDAPAPQAASIEVPLLSMDAKRGRLAFEENCIACHGVNGAGTEKGPPFMHKIYEPSHHGDYAFMRAVKMGVKGHHWRFGNMPPVQGVSDQDVGYIVAYVRELQRANGIQ